jgi:hypothetical protein
MSRILTDSSLLLCVILMDVFLFRITQGVLILGIISFLSCIFACCAGIDPVTADIG